METKHTFKNFEDYAKCAGDQSWKKLSSEYTRIAKGVKVYIVKGDFVRSNISADFTEGGHGYVYDYIPKDEIWVDIMKDKKDQYFNFQHEVYERSLMKADPKLSYNDAHDKALEREIKMRRDIDPEYTGEFSTKAG